MKDRWMRRIPILAMIALLGVVSCAASDNDGHMDAEASASGEAVIVYFSATGNTRAVAEELSEITGARSSRSFRRRYIRRLTLITGIPIQGHTVRVMMTRQDQR